MPWENYIIRSQEKNSNLRTKIAQVVERRARNLEVRGSHPGSGSNFSLEIWRWFCVWNHMWNIDKERVLVIIIYVLIMYSTYWSRNNVSSDEAGWIRYKKYSIYRTFLKMPRIEQVDIININVIKQLKLN